jgi:hypothetical protein
MGDPFTRFTVGFRLVTERRRRSTVAAERSGEVGPALFSLRPSTFLKGIRTLSQRDDSDFIKLMQKVHKLSGVRE